MFHRVVLCASGALLGVGVVDVAEKAAEGESRVGALPNIVNFPCFGPLLPNLVISSKYPLLYRERPEPTMKRTQKVA